jgi:hypothetical protein
MPVAEPRKTGVTLSFFMSDDVGHAIATTAPTNPTLPMTSPTVPKLYAKSLSSSVDRSFPQPSMSLFGFWGLHVYPLSDAAALSPDNWDIRRRGQIVGSRSLPNTSAKPNPRYGHRQRNHHVLPSGRLFDMHGLRRLRPIAREKQFLFTARSKFGRYFLERTSRITHFDDPLPRINPNFLRQR